MLLRVLAFIAVLSTVGGSALAEERSSPLLDHFKKLCDAGEGDGERALAIARTAGWTQLPDSMFAEADSPFEQATAMMNPEPDGTVVILLSGRMTETYKGVSIKMAVCGVMGMDVEKAAPISPDPAPIVHDWLAMSPRPGFSEDGMEGYAFTRNEAQRRPIVSDEATAEAASNGQMHVIMVGREEAMSMILYLRPRI